MNPIRSLAAALVAGSAITGAAVVMHCTSPPATVVTTASHQAPPTFVPIELDLEALPKPTTVAPLVTPMTVAPPVVVDLEASPPPEHLQEVEPPAAVDEPVEELQLDEVYPQPEEDLAACPVDGTTYTVGSCTLPASVNPNGLPPGAAAHVCTSSNTEEPADYPCDRTDWSNCTLPGDWRSCPPEGS